MFNKEIGRTLNVIELFAGVGGFRLGLEAVHGNSFKVSLSNQFEPSRKRQHASEIYQHHWVEGEHINEDIFKLLDSPDGQQAIRNAKPDMLVGGFPCQDYSVARPLSQSKGLAGKKGVLWWSIARVLQQCLDDGKPVKYLVLENVDRLLSSPASCKGRDFAVVLSTLHSMGYAAEWRVVNAADYGFPQRRKRVFIVAYHQTTATYRRAVSNESAWHANAVLTSAFPSELRNPLDSVTPALSVKGEPFQEQLAYQTLSNGKTRFANAGLMLNGSVWTSQVAASAIDDFSEFCGRASPMTLGDVVHQTGIVPTEFYVRDDAVSKWEAAKGAKRVPRLKNGFEYTYSEGAMAFPDPLDRPSRTIITSEGGATPTRTKHAVRERSGLIRRLTPEELEQLNGFPRGFTEAPGVSDSTRAMLMGNALVVGLVRRIGEALHREVIDSSRNEE